MLILFLLIKQRGNKRKKNVILVTKDINMRIKADSMGIEVEDYETDTVNIGELYSGIEEMIIPDNIVDRFYDKGYVEKEGSGIDKKLYPNQFVDFVSADKAKKQALAIYRQESGRIEKLIHSEDKIWGIKGRNREQKYAPFRYCITCSSLVPDLLMLWLCPPPIS